MFSKGGGDGGAAQARQAQQNRQNAIQGGTAQINGILDGQFTPDFYTGRRQAYLNFATPQLDDQYADARKQLTFSLDRSGLLDSSARTEKEAELQKTYDTNKRAISDRALGYENQARTAVEDARANLTSMLSATGDAGGAVSSAISRAGALSSPDAYDPIGQMFGTFTGALGNQAGLERMDAIAGSGVGRDQVGRYNTGLFAHNNSVKTY